jgi:hypothetical protein
MKVSYCQDIDTDAIYACRGSWGSEGMFRLRNPQTIGQQWEFLIPNSPTWDWIHQRIYRNPRVEEIRPEDFPTPLPPLPETPPGPFPAAKDYFMPKQPMAASSYPRLKKFLDRQERKEAKVYVVLEEDRYETVFGDGEFHDFDRVFLTREEAERYMDQNRGEWKTFHLREMTVKLDHEMLAFPEFTHELFDKHSIEKVVNALESLLGK